MPCHSLNILLNGICCWDFVNYRSGLIKALQKCGHSVTVLASADGYEDQLRALGVRLVCLQFERASLNPLHDLWLLVRYWRELGGLSPDVIFSFGIKPVIYGGIASACRGLRSVAIVTGLGSAFMSGRWLSKVACVLYQIGLGAARRAFFLNAEDLDYFLKRRLVSPWKAKLLPGEGVDMQHYAVQPWPEGDPVFLFVGRLLGDKGVREFVEAARVVRKNAPRVRFQLLGKIDVYNPSAVSKGEVEAWVREGVVSYLGVKDDVRPFIAASHIVALPSYREGLPRALLEAAASARPILTTDVVGCRDVVVDQVTGWVCAPHSSESLVKAILAAIDLPMGRLKEMGVRGREYVSERYSNDVVYEHYLACLADIAG